MVGNPKISFIVPVFNIVPYFQECIDSIIFQSFTDWSIVLIDDCSSDGSCDLCDGFAEKDSRITAIHNKNNIGPGLSRNEGIKHSTGDYIFFLDGDDTIEPDRLGDLWKTIEGCNYPDIVKVGYSEVFGFVTKSYDTNQFEKIYRSESIEDFLTPLLKTKRIGFRAWEFIYKKSMLVDNNIFFREARIWEDNDFTIRCLFSSYTIGYFANTFYYWRIRLSGSLTSSHTVMWDQIIRSAISMLGIYSDELKAFQKEWILKCVNSCIFEFEAIAGGINMDSIRLFGSLFKTISESLNLLKKFIYKNGLLWQIENYGHNEGSLRFVNRKRKDAVNLIAGKDNFDFYGFPATRKCLRLINILSQNGSEFKGLLDNDENKQGLMLDRYFILNPEIIRHCYNGNKQVFIVVTTSTRRTGRILSEQLMSYGLKEKDHFICTGFDEE
ncbi:glycosyltransferase [bacterium]|nr:glycosyltransferase [bacterium]